MYINIDFCIMSPTAPPSHFTVRARRRRRGKKTQGKEIFDRNISAVPPA